MQLASRFSTRDRRPHRSHFYKERKGGSPQGFEIEDFQPLHVKRAMENGRPKRVRHLNSHSVREFHFRGR
jgi:hypothetical protein